MSQGPSRGADCFGSHNAARYSYHGFVSRSFNFSYALEKVLKYIFSFFSDIFLASKQDSDWLAGWFRGAELHPIATEGRGRGPGARSTRTVEC